MEKSVDPERPLERFWMVFTSATDRNAPTVKHEKESSAIEEARRLAAKHQGHKVYVLETVGFAKSEKSPPPVYYYRLPYDPIISDQVIHGDTPKESAPATAMTWALRRKNNAVRGGMTFS